MHQNTVSPEDPLPSQVLLAAVTAWRLVGENCSILERNHVDLGLYAALAAGTCKRLEFVVGATVQAGGWEIMRSWPRAKDWRHCALVPRSLMGAAHEQLDQGGFELQAWWLEGDRVAFGNVEVA